MPTLTETSLPPNLTDYLPLGLNAQKVARKRYSVKNQQGVPIEEWQNIVQRVVDHVAKAELEETKRSQFKRAMTEIMLKREFIPNTPCLVNAGRDSAQLAACFVLTVPIHSPESWTMPSSLP
ncbi:MAG: hypothetical protein LC794_17670 [Acidobacteria bacterium]|nr:hypothetical protein [Acidobacteriota bacterium]